MWFGGMLGGVARVRRGGVCLVLGLAIACSGCADAATPAPLADGGVDGLAVGLAPPQLDPLPQGNTCSATLGLTGQAQPGVRVHASWSGSAGGVAAYADAATGRFCLPIALALGENRIEVRTWDAAGGQASEPAVALVSRVDCPEGPGTPGGLSRNVARDAPVTAVVTPDEGSLSMLTDGHLDGAVTVTGGGGALWQVWKYGEDFNGWIWVTLDQDYPLSSIIVHWLEGQGTGGNFGAEYSVLVSSREAPGEPTLDSTDWVQVAQVTAGDGNADEFTFDVGAVSARHVALWLVANGEAGNKESFTLTEIEVFDQPASATPDPAAAGADPAGAGAVCGN